MSKAFDSERETRVLLGEVRSELKVVAEGHTSVVKRLDKVEEKLGEHDQRFDRLEQRFDKFEFRFDKLEHRFDHLEYRFDKLDVQLSAVLGNHEGRLKALEGKSG